MHYLLSYLASLAAFLVIDGIWLGVVAKKTYRDALGGILREKPDLVAGIIFYVLYVAGVQLFAVLPLGRHFSGVTATFAMGLRVFLWGAGLGLFAYATYDLTNQSVAKGWKLKITILDMIWGAILTGCVTLVGYAVVRALA